MISREICRKVLQKAVSTGGDYAEIFAENTVKIMSALNDESKAQIEALADELAGK